MDNNNSVVSIFDSHNDAESAIKELQKSGFDMKKLSIMGKDYHTEENIIGYYNMGDRIATWGKYGAFWGWIWGVVFGSAFLMIPGVGPVIIGGPILTWIIGALETAILAGGFSALGAALVSFGIPKDSVLRYETAIKANKFMLILHGTVDEVKRAKTLLDQSKATETMIHSETKELVAAKA